MEQPGVTNKEETLAAWADIVIKIWQAKIIELKVWDTGELYRSLLNSLTVGAGNDVEKIEFSFNLYGRFVDMGHGREVWRDNPGDIGITPIRKEKPWFSKVLFWQVMRLREILIDKFGKDAMNTVVFTINEKEV
jgi:hypothetical protein